MEQLIAIFMALGLIAFGLFTGMQAFTMLREQLHAWGGARRSKTWAATVGHIKESKLTWEGAPNPRTHLLASYRYEVNGEDYLGETHRILIRQNLLHS